MTDELRPITTPQELADAIAEATRRHPDNPDAAASWFLKHYAMTEVVAESLRLQGQRELSGLN